jgi:hypothetical protein
MGERNQAAGGAGGGNLTREELEREEREADRRWILGCLGCALHKARQTAGGTPSWPLLSIGDRRAKMHRFSKRSDRPKASSWTLVELYPRKRPTRTGPFQDMMQEDAERLRRRADWGGRAWNLSAEDLQEAFWRRRIAEFRDFALAYLAQPSLPFAEVEIREQPAEIYWDPQRLRWHSPRFPAAA